MSSEPVALPDALGGTRERLDSAVWPLAYYIDTQGDAQHTPVLLLHSVNAAASAYEVRPIYAHFQGKRWVAAMDLPGFGFSARHARRYTPELMADAVQAMVDHLIAASGHARVHVLACSLTCEYLARAAHARPDAYQSLALVSPTGFDADPSQVGPRAYTRGRPWLYRALTQSSNFAQFVFRGLASKKSIRYFLEKTWGEKDIDEGVFEYAHKSAQQPGARHAPFSFLAGYLFSAAGADLYEKLPAPVWLAYGTMSDFTDSNVNQTIATHPQSTIVSFEAGALPHFQQPAAFLADYDRFLAEVEAG